MERDMARPGTFCFGSQTRSGPRKTPVVEFFERWTLPPLSSILFRSMKSSGFWSTVNAVTALSVTRMALLSPTFAAYRVGPLKRMAQQVVPDREDTSERPISLWSLRKVSLNTLLTLRISSVSILALLVSYAPRDPGSFCFTYAEISCPKVPCPSATANKCIAGHLLILGCKMYASWLDLR